MILSQGVIKERLKHLREILANLRELQGIHGKEFLSTYRAYWLAEKDRGISIEYHRERKNKDRCDQEIARPFSFISGEAKTLSLL
ncbi:MAG: hypothetical protein GTO24_27565 [candidate division Zixibacteria bacterium]|nr:hypothetical protein [candidate division Zixibacteria bacterium]